MKLQNPKDSMQPTETPQWVFYTEVVDQCVMGNNLNPIKLIALGAECTRNYAVESSKKKRLLKKPGNTLESVGPYVFICSKKTCST